MNLDDLIVAIRDASEDKAVQGMADQLSSWKDRPDTVSDLTALIKRYIGNVWIASEKDHQRIHALWSAFRTDCIDTIHGMTMNERLYSFGLIGRFYALPVDERQPVYSKLHASLI